MFEEAQAYIDPGAGSMLVQGIIGGIAAGFALCTLYWNKLKARLLSRRAGSPTDTQDEPSP